MHELWNVYKLSARGMVLQQYAATVRQTESEGK